MKTFSHLYKISESLFSFRETVHVLFLVNEKIKTSVLKLGFANSGNQT